MLERYTAKTFNTSNSALSKAGHCGRLTVNTTFLPLSLISKLLMVKFVTLKCH